LTQNIASDANNIFVTLLFTQTVNLFGPRNIQAVNSKMYNIIIKKIVKKLSAKHNKLKECKKTKEFH
jgi:hypothetical protein